MVVFWNLNLVSVSRFAPLLPAAVRLGTAVHVHAGAAGRRLDHGRIPHEAARGPRERGTEGQSREDAAPQTR